MSGDSNNPEEILGNYKRMLGECQALVSKISELSLERDEHKLVIDQLSTLEGDRKAFRLIGGVLVERTVGEVLPQVKQNHQGLTELIDTLEKTLQKKDTEKREYKNKHGIMTQDEREAMMKKQQMQQSKISASA